MKYLYVIICMSAALRGGAQAPVIHSVTPVSVAVEQYGRFEAVLSLSAVYNNPYDYDEVRVTAVFTGPAGATETVEGFFMQDYQLSNPATGALTPAGNGAFRVRFSPRQPGAWSYVVSCTTASGTGVFPAQNFSASPASAPANKGFIRTNQSNYLAYDNGEAYIPIGENIGWAGGNPYVDYGKWVGKLADQGGNFIRVWNCHWGLGLEWLNNGYSGLKRYRQNNSFYLDWLFDYCAERGVGVMLCLQHHGQVSSQVNPNWSESPYNAVNGGPCQQTWQFFTDPTAKNLVKNRLRYCLARWGYARSLMAWELFNEVNWTDNFTQHQNEIADWHLEMAAFLKANDPYQHVVTTSYAAEEYDPAVWNAPDIDLTQTHYYVDVPNLERVLAGGARNYLDSFGKPTLNGEFGLGPGGGALSTLDPDGIHLHNALWGALFGGASGTAMSWWWDNYIDPQDLYPHFAGISAVAGGLDLPARDYRPATATVIGAPADLSLTPSLGWGALADTSYSLSAGGVVVPPLVRLGQFLYGAEWNTQYRRPPVFHVDYPAAGPFRVKTGSQTGTSPKVAIWLDGIKVLESAAVPNQTHTITVPAGAHIVKVDNTGTDWISIASYTFAQLGTAVDAYVLRSADSQQAAGWLFNNAYNHQYIGSNGQPAAVGTANVQVSGMSDGIYQVNWFQCLSGALLGSATATATNGQLLLPVPETTWDLAFSVAAPSVQTAEVPLLALPFRVFPNPAASGGSLRIEAVLDRDGPVQVSLLDAGGRTVQVLLDDSLPAGRQTIEAHLLKSLSAGLYWVKVTAGGQAGLQAIAISR